MAEHDQIQDLASRWDSYSKEQRKQALKLLNPEQKTRLGELRGFGGETVAPNITYEQNPLTTREPLQPGQVPFNMGPGLPPQNVNQSNLRSSMAGAASAAPNPVGMGVGALAGAAFESKAPGTEIGQGAGQTAAMALLNKLLPGAGYGARALTSAAGVGAGGAVGTKIDQAAGNETQSGGTQGVAAILSGLLAGRGPRALPSQTGDAVASPFVQQASRPGGSEALARAVNKPLFRKFLQGNKQFAQDTFGAVDQYIDEAFEPIGQTDIINILGKTQAAIDTPNRAAFESTVKGILKAKDATRSSETILRTVFGEEVTQSAAAAEFLREALPTEDYKKISKAWLTHVYFRDALTKVEGLGGKGAKMLTDEGVAAAGRGTIPYVLTESGETALPYVAARGGPDFALSGEKLRFARERFGKANLETIVGPDAYAVIDDVTKIMDLVSVDKPGFRKTIRQGIDGTLRYQGNRFVYIMSGAGASLGAGSIAGMLPPAAALAAGGGLAIGLDAFIQAGVQNPALMTTLRKAAEAGDGRAASTAVRALMSAQATQPAAPPR